MKRAIRTLLLLAGPCLILSACAAGSTLYVPGDLTRPAGEVAPSGRAPQVVVADFSFTPVGEGVIGRDYDRARTIVWSGEPGKTMADLVAAVLVERGVPTVRQRAGAKTVETAPVRISGVLRRFEVNARRTGNFTVGTEATVSLTITGEGQGISGSLERTVTSTASLSDFFPTPDDVRQALMTTANTVAEEAARTLIEAKVVSPSP
ncbi:MAG: hypothetical protein IH610_12545 [Deltaproteobacteria bacterium]|nr:hypothetical protein [Deltaproteobacteria bacterium]